MYRVVKIVDFHLSLESTIFVSDIFSSVLGRNPWRISFLLFSRSKKICEKTNKTKQRVSGVCWLTPEQPEAFQTKQKKDIQFPPPFSLSMSLHFYYFFLFLYIVDPSFLISVVSPWWWWVVFSPATRNHQRDMSSSSSTNWREQQKNRKRKGCWL